MSTILSTSIRFNLSGINDSGNLCLIWQTGVSVLNMTLGLSMYIMPLSQPFTMLLYEKKEQGNDDDRNWFQHEMFLVYYIDVYEVYHFALFPSWIIYENFNFLFNLDCKSKCWVRGLHCTCLFYEPIYFFYQKRCVIWYVIVCGCHTEGLVDVHCLVLKQLKSA